MRRLAFKSNPWPVAIIAFFALFITAMVMFIVLASRQRTDLVRQDYYEAEIRYQEQLDRLNRTQALRAPVQVNYNPDRRSIRIILPPGHASSETTGQIHFYRPSDAGLDYRLELTVDEQGAQEVEAARLKAGLWKVRLDWQADQNEYYHDQSIVVPEFDSQNGPG